MFDKDYHILLQRVARIIQEAKQEYRTAKSTTGRMLAHQKAESARALLGFSGGPDGSDFIII